MNKLQELLKRLKTAQAEGNEQHEQEIVLELEQLADQPQFKGGSTAVICNLTDRQITMHRTYGVFTLKGARPGQAYALTVVHSRMDAIDYGDKRTIRIPVPAGDIAADLCHEFNDDAGDGSFLGAFVCALERPTEAELREYGKKLTESDLRFVEAADKAHEANQGAVYITNVHRAALGRLGLEKEWARSPQSLPDCPSCGMKIRPNIVKCPHCHAILDQKRWKKQFAEAETVEAVGAAAGAKK